MMTFFLGNPFINEDDKDDGYELESRKEKDEVENKADVIEVEQEIGQIEKEDVDKKHQMNPKILQQFNGSKSSKLLMIIIMIMHHHKRIEALNIMTLRQR